MANKAIAQADPLAPGLRIGRYELIRRLAVGGMAEIYLARATGIEGFEKLVVLKRILPQFAANGSFVSMFLDEARLTARLQHPNIAQVYDIGEFGGSYFFTMEFVRGADVRAMLKTALILGEAIPLEHVVTIILGVTAGLHAAHEKRGLDGTPLHVVHRDVSPSNVLVSYDGAVKLVDFGVAKAAQHRNRTQAGTLKGKAAYMSPEQCLGKPLDRRSDIFAIGILLYELACCRRLFVGESEFEIMSKIVNEDVTPPSVEDPSFPPGLERILLRALNRNPDDRYASAQAMQLDLEEFARHDKLAASTVRLGDFMREMFCERMREQEELIAQQLQTGEVVAEVGNGEGGEWEPECADLDLSVEIEAEVADGLRGPGLRGVHTAMFASVDSVSSPWATGPTGASRARREALAEVSRSLESAAIGRDQPYPRRQWPWALVGAAAAAGSLYVASFGDTRDERREVRATVEAPANAPAATTPVDRALEQPRSLGVAGSTAPAVAEGVAPKVDGSGAPAVDRSGAPKVDGSGAPGAETASGRRSTRASELARDPPAARKRPKRSRQHTARNKRPRRASVPDPGPPATESDWSLDSPLPPPRGE